MSLSIKKEGRRYYILGNTFPVKDRLKAAKCRFDGDARAWWTSKKEVAETLVRSLGKEIEEKAKAQSEFKAELENRRKAGWILGKTACKAAEAKAEGGIWDRMEEVWLLPSAEAMAKVKAKVQARRGSSQKAAPKTPKTTKGRWDEVPLVGTKEGSVETLQQREPGGGRGYKPDITGEVGRVFRVSKRGGKLAGKIAYCVGSEAYYTSADFEEDCGQPGLGSGWWIMLYVREATAEEAQPVLDAEKLKAAAEEKKKNEEVCARQAWEAAVAKATKGLVPTSWCPFPADQRQIAEHKRGGSVRLTLHEGEIDGTRVVVVHMHSFDDSRTTVYGPEDFVKSVHWAKAEELGIDKQEALRWLSQYAGCHGQELYRQMAGFPREMPAEEVELHAKNSLETV